MSVLQMSVIAALVVFLIVRRFQSSPVSFRRTAVLPIALTVYGVYEIGHQVHGSLPGRDAAFLVAGGIAALLVGAVRGATVGLFERDGVLWSKYHLATFAAWLATFAIRIGFDVLAHGAGAGLAASSSTIALMIGLSLLGEGLVVGARARYMGIPIQRDRGGWSASAGTGGRGLGAARRERSRW